MSNSAVEATYKSKDTEEWLDIHFTRPIGYVLARFFGALNVHPNVVTVISIFLGVFAGFCWYHTTMDWTVLGIAMLMLANFLDSADGQLARMTGKKTLWGRLLDGFAGDTWFASIYIFLVFRLMYEPMPFFDGRIWGVWIWIIEFFSSLVFHSRQASLADYYRNVYLLFHGDHAELNDSRELAAEQAVTPWKERWFWKIGLFFYTGYTRSQEKMTPQFQNFRSAVREKYGDAIPSDLGQEFCRRTFRFLKWTNISTFNTRAIVLYVTLLIGQPWIYFIFELTVMNVIFFCMRHGHEKVCREMTEKL
ncbi:MAG: CDP-alcohol phosphatidyltransferase family protein [Bacteroidaceae bacterium]|nr:CDP-alcohol phosphatidyltransferase family protein [Candidatus Colenecus caballi]MCQ2071683.1 CDP-alcohol phosphatidyltransferase family protein [Bacteroidaceae bacterium]